VKKSNFKWEMPQRHLTNDDIPLANKHTERCSILNVIKGLQIKTAMIYHYTQIKMAYMQNTKNIKRCGGCRTTGILLYC
jgi:hypothetical protein